MPATYGILLAGGLGTRLEAQLSESGKSEEFVTPQVIGAKFGFPKPLMPIARGKFPMMLNGLAHLKASGVTNVTIVVKEGYESLFREVIGDGSAFGMKITYASQSEARGIPDAVKCAIDKMHSEKVLSKKEMADSRNKFIVVAGDNVYRGDELTQIFADFNRSSKAQNSCVSLELPIGADKLKAGRHVQKNKEGREQLKWGIQYKWKDEAGKEHVELVEKPLLEDHLKTMQRKGCKAFALTAYYELSDSPQSLLIKIQEALDARPGGKGEINMPAAVLSRYIAEGKYVVGAPILLENWVDLGEAASLAGNNFQVREQVDQIKDFIYKHLINGAGCKPSEAMQLLKNYRKLIREKTNVITLYQNGILACEEKAVQTETEQAKVTRLINEITNASFLDALKYRLKLKDKVNELFKDYMHIGEEHVSIRAWSVSQIKDFINKNKDLILKAAKEKDAKFQQIQKYKLFSHLKSNFIAIATPEFLTKADSALEGFECDWSTVRIMKKSPFKLSVDLKNKTGQSKTLTFKPSELYKINKKWELSSIETTDGEFENVEELKNSLGQYFKLKNELRKLLKNSLGQCFNLEKDLEKLFGKQIREINEPVVDSVVHKKEDNVFVKVGKAVISGIVGGIKGILMAPRDSWKIHLAKKISPLNISNFLVEALKRVFSNPIIYTANMYKKMMHVTYYHGNNELKVYAKRDAVTSKEVVRVVRKQTLSCELLPNSTKEQEASRQAVGPQQVM